MFGRCKENTDSATIGNTSLLNVWGWGQGFLFHRIKSLKTGQSYQNLIEVKVLMFEKLFII